MKPFIIASLLLLSSFQLYAQSSDVDVIWQHVFGGNDESWEELATRFALEREMLSTRPSVGTSNGVAPMATEIVNSTLATANDRTIAVGHSMGGVALRHIGSVTSPGHVDAMITVGSPLNGARIADNLLNGNVADYITHGVRELQKGLRRQFFVSFIVARAAGRNFTSGQLHEVLFEENGFDDLLLEQFSDRLPSVQDLSVNGSYMQTARGFNPGIPKISLHGNENRPVHYRLASSFTDENDEDDMLPIAVKRAEHLYQFLYLWNRWRIWSPIHRWRASGWRAGRNYLRSGSETGWNQLIGATRRESVTTCFPRFTCSLQQLVDLCMDRGQDPTNCSACQTTLCDTRVTLINEPSDGFIHETSQRGNSSLAIPSSWTTDVDLELLGVNHEEEKTHPATVGRLNEIFDRSPASVSSSFQVDRR